jgi:hypothetical protein
MNHPALQKDTPAWIFQVWASFLISLILSSVGIAYLPVDVWMRGYVAIAFFFTVASSFTLAKTLRDNQETGKMLNRITEAKTERLLQEIELK